MEAKEAGALVIKRRQANLEIPSLIEALAKTAAQPREIQALQVLVTESVEQWRYKGEGAAHLVLSYAGDNPTSPLKGQVLRVEKRFKNGEGGGKGPQGSHALHIPADGLMWFQGTPVHVENHELKEYAFVHNVMRPLIGPSYVHPGVPIVMTPAFLGGLGAGVEQSRPELRRKDTEIDVDSKFAFLMPDLSLLPHAAPAADTDATTDGRVAPIICVEIKPKWGFLPYSPLIRAPHSIKTRVCRYCMHQRLKLKKGEIDEISAYCPIDLFSGEPARIRRALVDMLHVPQNNVKIYADGELAYTGSLGGKLKGETTFDLEHLERKMASVFAPADDGSCISTMVDVLCRILHEETVLPNLRSIQQMDYLDIEGIYYLHKKIKEHGLDALANEWDETTLQLFEGDSEDRERFVEKLKRGQLQESDMVELIRDYLISMTAKDCSVMITLLPVPDPHHHQPSHTSGERVVEEKGRRYAFRVAVVDVDPKPVQNIPYWYRLDQEIVDHFIALQRQLQEGSNATTHTTPRCLFEHHTTTAGAF